MFVVAVRAPEVPVIVTTLIAGVAELSAVSMSKLVPVVGFDAQDAVTPLGRPDITAKLTPSVNPA